MKRKLSGILTENLSYKLISLFIALILWITILGRSDSIVTRQMEVEIVSAATMIATPSTDRVKIRVSGPRTALRRFVENGLSPVISLDLSTRDEGVVPVTIPRSKIDLPFGVRLISMSPEVIEVRLERKK